MKERHEQKLIALWNGETVSVDADIAELIAIMNMPGLRTTRSCQGENVFDMGAYVQFSGKLAKPFMHAMLAAMLEERNSLVGLRFESSPNNTWRGPFVIRWHFFHYHKVLRYARKARRHCQQVKRRK